MAITNRAEPLTQSRGITSDIIQRFRQNIQTYTIILALLIIWAIFTFVTNGAYISSQNFSNLFRQMTITALLGVGMVLVIVLAILLPILKTC